MWVPHKWVLQWFALYNGLFDYNLWKQSKWWRRMAICSWMICTHMCKVYKCCIKHFDHLDPSVSCRCAETATPTCLVCLVVNLTHCQHARNALKALLELVGKQIGIMWTETDSTLRKSVISNIIIKGLARDINNLALSRTFSRFREMLSSRVVCDSNDEQKGWFHPLHHTRGRWISY